MTIERMHTGPRMSQVVIHNTTVYLAGQVASGAPGKSVTEQTKDILSTIDSLLAAAKTDKSKLLSATIWLTDMSTFAEMNSVWDTWVVPGATPARATVVSAKLAAPEFSIEIAVIAAPSQRLRARSGFTQRLPPRLLRAPRAHTATESIATLSRSINQPLHVAGHSSPKSIV